MTLAQVKEILGDINESVDKITELEKVSYITLLSGGVNIATFNKTFLFESSTELMYEYVNGDLNDVTPFSEINGFNIVCYITPKHPQINGGIR